MTISGGDDAKMFVYMYAVLMVCFVIVTVFRCWRALAYVRLCRHRRELEWVDKQIELEKAKHPPAPLPVPAAPYAQRLDGGLPCNS